MSAIPIEGLEAEARCSGKVILGDIGLYLSRSKPDTKKWFSQVKSSAERIGVWDYVNPDLKDDERKKLGEPEEPGFQTWLPNANCPSELNKTYSELERFKVYKMAYWLFEKKLMMYDRLRGKLEEFRNELRCTLGYQYWRYCHNVDTLYEDLVEIKRLVT
jgi:hypothetical protein